MNLTGITITGIKISYYFICKSKLWLFSHNIQMEHNSENVKIGKIINESSYGRDKKDVMIDNTICVDFIKKRDGLEIHEIKKSKKMDDAHRWQLIYYLYYLNQKGVDAIGVLNYPLLNKKEIVEARDKDFEYIEYIIKDIKAIVSDKMPKINKKRICKKCSYYEFCFGDC